MSDAKKSFIYTLRLKLSEMFFRLGKNVHPDISALTRKIQADIDKMHENDLTYWEQ